MVMIARAGRQQRRERRTRLSSPDTLLPSEGGNYYEHEPWPIGMMGGRSDLEGERNAAERSCGFSLCAHQFLASKKNNAGLGRTLVLKWAGMGQVNHLECKDHNEVGITLKGRHRPGANFPPDQFGLESGWHKNRLTEIPLVGFGRDQKIPPVGFLL